MSETVKVGRVEIEVRRYADGRYGFDSWLEGERHKIRRRTLEKAVSVARDTAELISRNRQSLIAASPAELAEFQAWQAKRRSSASLDAVAKELQQSKDGRMNARYLRGLRDDINAFVKFAGRHTRIAEVDAKSVESFLQSLKVGPRRRNNIRAELVTLFRFAQERGYLPNETTQAERVKRVKVPRQAVSVFTPDEMRGFLDAVKEEWLPWLALGGFAGIRTEEITRMDWSMIRWEKSLIDLPATATKTNERRLIPIKDNLAQWLASWRNAEGSICSSRPDREAERLAKATKVAWRNNALRHSYGSYRVAESHDVPRVALEMGNSVAMVKRHYYEAQHEEAATEWFGIAPKVSGKVIVLNNRLKSSRKCR